MTSLVFPAALAATVAVDGEAARFPVRRIFCVGRNYASHAREMGGDPTREPPFFFGKPADAVVESGSTIAYPPETADLHHEVELVVAIGKSGFAVAAEQALDLVFGYAVGIDLTRRDLQQALRKVGRPWDWAKGFDDSAPCGAIRRVERLGGHPSRGAIGLSVDGVTRQAGDLSEMIWSVPETIAIVSRSMQLRSGDLIFTGTPEGVGALVPGNHVIATIEGLPELTLHIGLPRTAAD